MWKTGIFFSTCKREGCACSQYDDMQALRAKHVSTCFTTCVDIAAARQDLDLWPIVDLQQGLQENLGWFLSGSFQATAVPQSSTVC